MTFEGSVIKEQGVTFAVVVVKKHVIDNRQEANKAVANFQPIFPGIPIVLMAQNLQGKAYYYGRDDLAKFLANTPLSSIPWKKYTI